MVNKREAEELLMIEEADAWFEYLEATRSQSETALPRGRAVGLGAAQPAAASDPHAPREAAPGRGLGGRRPPGRCYAPERGIMPSSSITTHAAHGAPMRATPVRAPHKENQFAPAMVSQEEADAGQAAPPQAPAPEAAPRPSPKHRTQAAPETGDGRKSKAPPRIARRQEPPQAVHHGRDRDRRGRGKPAEAEARATASAPSRRTSRRSSPQPRRRQQQRRAPLPAAKRELLVSVDVTEKRVAVLEDDRVAEVYLERPGAPLDRRQHLQGRRRQRASGHGGGVRRDRPREERLPLRRRDRRPGARGQAPARPPDHRPDQPRRGGARPGGQGPDEDEGRPPDDRDLAARPLRRLRPERGHGPRRLAPARGRRAQPPQRDR